MRLVLWIAYIDKRASSGHGYIHRLHVNSVSFIDLGVFLFATVCVEVSPRAEIARCELRKDPGSH